MSDQILLDNIDNILSNIALKLINDDNLMKLLKFNSVDALSRPISLKEKHELINQVGDITNTRVFYQPFNNTTFKDEVSQLRIYYGSFKPENIFITKVNIGIEVVVNNNIWRLDGGLQRPIQIIKHLLNILNNKQFGGIGELIFTHDSSLVLRYFNSDFTGYSFNLQTRLT